MSESRQKRIAIFPGSFNPFTVGHQSIVDRALEIFDEVVIAIGISASKPGHEADTQPIERLYEYNPRVKVMTYQGLTVDAAREAGAGFIVRGVRNINDFQYEMDMAEINRRLSGIETVMLPTLPEYATVSSSLVRELSHYGRDVSDMMPKN